MDKDACCVVQGVINLVLIDHAVCLAAELRQVVVLWKKHGLKCCLEGPDLHFVFATSQSVLLIHADIKTLPASLVHNLVLVLTTGWILRLEVKAHFAVPHAEDEVVVEPVIASCVGSSCVPVPASC